MTNIAESNCWDLYDPNWEQKWQEHMDACQKLQAQPNKDENTRLLIDYHSSGWQNAFVSQFKNGKEYADYLLNTVKFDASIHKVACLKLDTSQVETRAQANQVYKEALQFVEKQKDERRTSLPVSSKNNPIFSEKSTQSFQASFDGWYGSTTDTIITAQDHNGELNICLTHPPENEGTSVMNNIKNIATHIYNGTLYRKYPDPKKVNWYFHAPAEVTMRKMYQKVTMSYNGTCFENPNFESIKEVPVAIKKARYNVAQEELVTKNPTENSNRKNNVFRSIKKMIFG